MEKKPLLICLTPVRNEEWVLNAFLKATSLWADYIVIADQGSTDESRKIAREYSKVILIDNNNPDFNEAERQKLLIDKAREVDGDKILFALDADEIFSANFMNTSDWNSIVNSKQGDVFWFKWAQVLSDKIHYWVPQNYYPWVFHDDGKEPHGNYTANIHSMRIPYPIEENQMFYVDDFKVMHFQHYFPKRNMAKQRFYMLIDYSLNQRSTIKLSRTYANRRVKEKHFRLTEEMIYNEEIHGLNLFDLIDTETRKFWFDKYVVERIIESGERAYKNLDIWTKPFIEENNLKDPRDWAIKLLHFYLRNTNNFSGSIAIRAIDKILKKSGI